MEEIVEISCPEKPAAVSGPSARPRAASRLPQGRIRRGHDRSQMLRRGFQLGFLLLNVYLGGVFYLWVRQLEGMRPGSLVRPAGVEGWLPIAGLMNFKYWLATGRIPTVHPAAMFLLIAFLATAFLFRKAFCGWLCPIGTFSEYLWRAGRKLIGRNFHLPHWPDVFLRGLKYLLLGFFAWVISSMSSWAIEEFMHSPYGIIADVKMLNFFRHLGEMGLVVLVILAVASLFIQNFWCRYLCPYGALLGLVAMLSPARIRRNDEACIDCAKCTKVCPSALPVHQLITVKSAECTGCLECVAVCPAPNALEMSLPPWRARRPARLPAWAWAVGIAALFFGIVGYAKATGHWNGAVPRAVYVELIPQADQARHPMPGY